VEKKRRLLDGHPAPEESWLGLGLSMEPVKVELGGLEPPTPCLQSDVFACCGRADLARQSSVSSREVPLLTPANDANGTTWEVVRSGGSHIGSR
jgi:hypothetical protein